MKNGKKLDYVHDRIINQISENMKSYGFPKTIGHVIAIIHYEDRPMNLDELAEQTGMSKTRMSQVMREMVDLNIAEKVFIKGSRKDTYKVEQNYYQTFVSLFTQNWQDVVKRNRKIDEEILEDVKEVMNSKTASEDEKAMAKSYYEDTLESQAFFNWVERLVSHFQSHEVFKHVPKSKE